MFWDTEEALPRLVLLDINGSIRVNKSTIWPLLRTGVAGAELIKINEITNETYTEAWFSHKVKSES